jgi:hypothetical protein
VQVIERGEGPKRNSEDPSQHSVREKVDVPNLAERLPNLGLRVERVDVGSFTAEHVSLFAGHL